MVDDSAIGFVGPGGIQTEPPSRDWVSHLKDETPLCISAVLCLVRYSLISIEIISIVAVKVTGLPWVRLLSFVLAHILPLYEGGDGKERPALLFYQLLQKGGLLRRF